MNRLIHSCFQGDASLGGSSGASILISITERVPTTSEPSSTEDSESERAGGDDEEDSDNSSHPPEYGICIVDSVIGTVTLAQFQDDQLRSRLRTLIARYGPTEALLEFRGHSAETLGCLRLLAPGAAMETLRGAEMPSVDGAVVSLRQGQYFAPPAAAAAAAAAAASSSGKKRAREVEGAATEPQEGELPSEMELQQWPPLLQAVVGGLHDGTRKLGSS